jgi:ribose 5-phosphate isomerase B
MGLIEVEGCCVPVGSHIGKTIVLGSDHRGFELRNRIRKFLEEQGFLIIDVGCESPKRCDYPLVSEKIAEKLCEVDDHSRVGIGICGSGIGICIPASKYPGLLCARCLNPDEAVTSRKHNNTNFLGLGADYTEPSTAKKTAWAWLNTAFYSDPCSEDAYLKRYLQTIRSERRILGKKKEK